MNLYYSLAKEINVDKLVSDMANMITKFTHEGGDLPNSILVCSIVTILDHTGDSLFPKIEHKNIDCTT